MLRNCDELITVYCLLSVCALMQISATDPLNYLTVGTLCILPELWASLYFQVRCRAFNALTLLVGRQKSIRSVKIE